MAGHGSSDDEDIVWIENCWEKQTKTFCADRKQLLVGTNTKNYQPAARPYISVPKATALGPLEASAWLQAMWWLYELFSNLLA